jgi:hypothetical protein
LKDQYVTDLEARCEALEKKCQEQADRIEYLSGDGRFAEIPKEDLYSLDFTFACFIRPRLEAFLENSKTSIPGCLLSEFENKDNAEFRAAEKWKGILQEMIEGFRIVEEDCSTIDDDLEPKIERALQLFSEWYRALWT